VFNRIRHLLYRLAILLGDVNAVRQGPTAIGKRMVRKMMQRNTARLLRRFEPW